jgi:predicted HicB family RNase H-like nuclease
MPYTEAQKRASRKYNEKTYDRLEITVNKGHKEKIKAFATNNGESLNGFVNRIINEAMGVENTGEQSMQPSFDDNALTE